MLTISALNEYHEYLTENLIKETNFGELHLLKSTLISGRVLNLFVLVLQPFVLH